jgi:manganese/zinc/iron transport system substrate-binding protein
MRLNQNLVYIGLVLVLIVGCGKKVDKSEIPLSERQINVVTTIGMITDIVQTVGGVRVSVSGLMGPGVDPHLYKASEGDMTKMMRADIIFYNGLHLEGAMAELFERMASRINTAAVTDGIDPEVLLSPPEFEGAHDPHVWFDITLWMMAVEQVRDRLSELDPQSTKLYGRNANTYLEQLAELHAYVQEQVYRVELGKRVLITAHDAFNYFGRAYGFKVRGLQGISTATEAGTADIRNQAEFIVQNQIPSIFVESSVPPRTIEALQAAVLSRGMEVKIGGQLFSDAMGEPGSEAGTYIGMVRHNVDTIVLSLLGE